MQTLTASNKITLPRKEGKMTLTLDFIWDIILVFLILVAALSKGDIFPAWLAIGAIPLLSIRLNLFLLEQKNKTKNKKKV